MTDHSAPGPDRKASKGRTTTQAVETETTLDAEPEKAVRMRYGLGAPDDLPLAQKSEGLPPEVAAQLLAIERRAFEESGRYAELAAEAGVDLADPAQAQQQAVKRKIIDRLKGGPSEE